MADQPQGWSVSYISLDIFYFSYCQKQPPEVFYKKLFLKIGQYSPENTCGRVKPTQVFSCEYCEIFRNTYFEENLRTTVSLLP